ncbi:MarR family winged helix-turn-helix transcriptional regulator [Desulfospira joergensenii]|uniref:MarR family winged helix-turn-helix transcriptional regulator n=1 Tax=Desulfospira joergensenii TaxID=53329 RepID=UPI000489D360|nr:MarR family transcriptional regulator [Desulfospira joergensenii]
MTDQFFTGCLFFNINAFSRQMTKMAEAHFKPLNLSPAHASLLLVVFHRPGISPKELSKELRLTPSTITRFVDSLCVKDMVERESRGKTTKIFPTKKSLELKASIAGAYKGFYLDYTKILGTQFALNLSQEIARAGEQMDASNQKKP